MSHKLVPLCYSLHHPLIYKTSSPGPQVISTLLPLDMSAMVPELEKPRVTEIQVRMDCHGCVQKVKKALNGITGIYDVHINYPEQKITLLGWADPEKIVKAIRKMRKTATICAHFEPDAAATPAEQPAEGGSGQPAPPVEPPKDQPPLQPDNPQQVTADAGQPLIQPEPESGSVIYHQPPDSDRNIYTYGPGCAPELSHFQTVRGYPTEPLPQPPQQIHEAHGYISYRPSLQMYTSHQSPKVRATHNYNTRRSVSQTYATQPPPAIQESQNYQLTRPSPQTNIIQPPQQIQEPQNHSNFFPSPQTYTSRPRQLHYTSQPPLQVQTTHSYNIYSPSPYVTEYDYIQPPAAYTPYNQMGQYSYPRSSNNNGNISTMFSDENPNACTIM